MTSYDTSRPVLFFDGVCNLCNSSVQFIIRHDKKKRFLFATLQSPIGDEALKNVDAAREGTGSVILVYNNTYYTRSAAILQSAKLLGGLWPVFYSFIIIPAFLRDGIYNFISRNRYRWFGRKDVCMMPDPSLSEHFLS